LTSNGECVNATTKLFQDREVLLYADANTEARTRLMWATASNRLDAPSGCSWRRVSAELRFSRSPKHSSPHRPLQVPRAER